MTTLRYANNGVNIEMPQICDMNPFTLLITGKKSTFKEIKSSCMLNYHTQKYKEIEVNIK